MNTIDPVLDLSNIYFISSNHNRYDNGIKQIIPQGGANRAIKIENNINGNEGYTVTIYNLDSNHPIYGDNIQMAPKPMRIQTSSVEKTALIGYGNDPKAFGDPRGSFANYGITIFHHNNKIEKIILHMHNKNAAIEYLK